MPVLEFQDVTLATTLADRPVDVLRRISFALEGGDTLGLVGESGAGKSMLTRLISGLLPDGFHVRSGRVLFRGTDLLTLAPGVRRGLLGRSIAFIPQEPLSALNPVRTIGSQMDEHLRRLGVPRSQRRDRALAMLESVRLPEPDAMHRRYPHELSGGQCQRVLIAMAFGGAPQLVIADEPTTALDVVTQSHVMRLIADKQREHGSAVIFITHDLGLAAEACARVGVMYAGDLVEFGPAHAVLRNPCHPYTRNLLAATPSVVGPRRRLPGLSEHMPGLLTIAAMPGCRFAARCPVRDHHCVHDTDERVELSPGHWARMGETCRHGPGAVRDDTPPPLPERDPAATVPLLEFRGVGLRYTRRGGLFGRARTVDAVRGASFSVHPGEFVAVVGESGSGKSSIARMMVGLEHPTSGTILINGKDAAAATAEERRAIQMVFQDPDSALNPRRSVASLLTQALEAAAPRPSEAERAVAAQRLLAATGLPSDTLARYPSQLSGGQKQRVNIGRALCVTPKLLVADEIVSGLDVSVQSHILNLLLRLREEQSIGVVFITHDLAVARYLCRRVIVMFRGEIVEAGETQAVFARPQHPYTRSLLAAAPQAVPAPAPCPPGGLQASC